MLLVLGLQHDDLFRRLQIRTQLAGELDPSPLRLLLEDVDDLLYGALWVKVADFALKLLIRNLPHVEQVLHKVHQQVGIRFYLLHVLPLRLGHRLVAGEDDVDDHYD